jgi:hypothetical protein
VAIIDQQYRTIKCDGQCGKSVTFNLKEAKETITANPWIQGVRVVTTGDGRIFTYCSDDCEVAGATTGNHNLPTKKVVSIVEGSDAAIKQAAAEASAREQVDAAIRKGPPVQA